MNNAFVHYRHSFTLLDTPLLRAALKIMLNKTKQNVYYSCTYLVFKCESCHELKHITRCIPPCLVTGKQYLYE